MTVSFGDPQPVSRWEGNDWPKVGAALKARKGKFGHVGQFSTGIASHLRSGRYKAFLPEALHDADPDEKRAYMRDHWEVTTRTVPPPKRRKTDDDPLYNRCDVYIKWLG